MNKDIETVRDFYDRGAEQEGEKAPGDPGAAGVLRARHVYRPKAVTIDAPI